MRWPGPATSFLRPTLKPTEPRRISNRSSWLGWMWFLLKVFLILFFYVWMRWTLPRYRYDQLMEFGWKWLLPLAVINLLVTAAVVVYGGF